MRLATVARWHAAAVDVKRATDLYAQGWTLRQIGAELGVHWSTVSQQRLTYEVPSSNQNRSHVLIRYGP
jgi:hypothetical protein